MDSATFQSLRDVIHQQSGIALSDDQQNLLSNRLSRRLSALRLDSIESYLELLQTDQTGEELLFLLNAISTNYTFFFREARHFQVLEELVRERAMDGQRRFRIWCAASSTGEEPYSMAMTLASCFEMCGFQNVDCKILATDLCTDALQTASDGVYDSSRLSGISEQFKRDYLVPLDGQQKRWRIADPIRDMITYRRLNLSDSHWPMKGPFDAIFCRNVMIYFDEHLRRKLVGQCADLLNPGGLFFVGMTESILGLTESLAFHEPSAYRLPPTSQRLEVGANV